MARDLSDSVDFLLTYVNPPGTDLYPDATPDDWLNRLRAAFFNVKMRGMLAGFEENVASRSDHAQFGEGIVSIIGGGGDPTYYDDLDWKEGDISDEELSLVYLWAAWRVLFTAMQSSNAATLFRAKAGPVEFETQQGASVLKGLLDAAKQELEDVLQELSANGATGTLVLDAVIQRDYAQVVGDTWWVR